MERAKLKEKAKKRLKGKYTTLVVSLILFVTVYFIGDILDMIFNSHFLANLFLIIASILLMMGFVDSVMKTARGKKIEIENLFDHIHLGFKYLIISLVISLVISFLVLLLAISYKALSTIVVSIASMSLLSYILLVIAGSVLSVIILAFLIYLLISFSQVYFILNDEPEEKIGNIINMSFDMLDGYRLEYLTLYVSFIGWFILGIFTFGILYLWLIPYMMVTLALYYDKLKERYSYSKPLKDDNLNEEENVEE